MISTSAQSRTAGRRANTALGVVLLCLMAVSGLASNLLAEQWDQGSYQLRSWSLAEGLPGNHVSALAQDADGFLWLATMSGLVRFDGVEFRVYNERNGDLPSGRFNAVDVGPSGRLWIGSEQGHLILREDGRFRVVVEPRYPGIHVTSIAEAKDGSVWFIQGASSRSGLDYTTLQHWTGQDARLRPDVQAMLTAYPRDRDYTSLDKPGGLLTLENRFPQVLFARDAAGAVWARAWSGSSVRVSDGLGDPFGPGDSTVLMLGSAQLMAQSRGDRVDLLDLDSGARVATLERDGERLQGVWLRDQRGHVWVSEINALKVYGADSSSPLAQWPLDTKVLDLEQDSEGNIWVATRTRGLLRIAANPVRQLDMEQGIPLPRGFWPQSDGSALMATQLIQPEGDEEERLYNYRFRPDGQLPSREPIGWQLKDRVGTEWVYAMMHLQGTREDGSTVSLQRYCAGLYLDPLQDDILWARSEGELMRIRTHADRDPEVVGEWTTSIRSHPLFDAGGSLWIGSANGLHHIDGDRQRLYTRSDGLPVNEVRSLYRDPHGDLWIGTYGGGLAHFDGSQLRIVDQRHGLMDNTLSSIVPDRFGALWMGGNRGIQRVRLDDLRGFISGRIPEVPARLFDHSHGLDNAEAVGSYSGVAVGERLYFATFGGVAVIDPAVEARREALKPKVHLLDGATAVPLLGDSALTLAQGLRRLELPVTAVHLSAPETLRFRHQLEGYDSDWIETGSRRSLTYNTLRPGNFRLRVQARHSGGPWVDAGGVARIEVIPLWWETPTAWVLGVFAILGLFAGSWLWANRRVRQRALALEALVAERTAALQAERDQVARQATRLQELAEGRARFMSGISHELRTPLSLILAPLSDLGEGRHGALPEAVKTQISGAHRNSQRLLRLVERLLEVARVEAGVQTLHCVEIDLRAALVELISQLQPLAQQRGSILEAMLPDDPVPVWVDPLLMESVLVNLMVNGLRHTPAGSRVWVELHGLSSGDETITLTVQDNGPGIPSAALPHLFERFFRVRGEHASGSDGFGLGLPLVREVLERHGGQVEVQSSGSGTCFHLQLRAGCKHLRPADIATAPLAERQQPAMLSALLSDSRHDDDNHAESVADSGVDEHAKRVLVVDDNAELRRLLRSYLQPEFRVLEADSGISALQRIAEELPDLIISDVMMPEMDGHEFCRRLRADPESDFLPLLMLTAKAGLEHRIEGLEGGADAYLSKPFDRRELLATVHGLLATRQRLQQHFLKQKADIDTDTASLRVDHDLQPEPESVHQSPYVQRLTAIIEAQLADENFDIDTLADAMAQDRSTLYRAVKNELGISPSELLREIRLLRAQALLQGNEGSVSEVAYAVGFKTVAHFSTRFRERFGCTPSRLRQDHVEV